MKRTDVKKRNELEAQAMVTFDAFEAHELRALVRHIRATCARELGEDVDYDWFWANGREGEAADARLIRLFRAERDAQRSRGWDPTDEEVVLVLCHG